MSHLPEKDVQFVVSGIDEVGDFKSIDHSIKEIILPAAKSTAQDIWIVSPFLIPELIFPVDVRSSRPSRKELHSYMDGEFRSRLKGWFRSFTRGSTRINLLTNSITYDEDGFLLEERRTFAKILLDVFGENGLNMTSVYELSEENRPRTSSGIHAKAIVAGRRAAYLGSANFTRAGFVNNIEFGAVFSGFHGIAGEMLESCRNLALSDYFEVVHLDEEGQFTHEPPSDFRGVGDDAKHT
jgi:phosphatidylserine/phosphatidylglycerophosphate/cardiolipin synthase-like enzyme